MVKSANTQGLLESINDSLDLQEAVKDRLHALMSLKREFSEEDTATLASTGATSLLRGMEFMQNPVQMCEKVSQLMHLLNERILELKEQFDRSKRAPSHTD